MSARHRAPGRPSTPLTLIADHVRAQLVRQASTAAAATAALAIAANPAVATGFDDASHLEARVTAYTVPAAAQGTWQSSGTGELIRTRLQVACDDASTPEWRFRDHVAGTAWHGWLPWQTTQSEPGHTAWVTSGLGAVGVVVETQFEVRCTTGTWIGQSETSAPAQITRTT